LEVIQFTREKKKHVFGQKWPNRGDFDGFSQNDIETAENTK
jgi:hypothetical protein